MSIGAGGVCEGMWRLSSSATGSGGPLRNGPGDDLDAGAAAGGGRGRLSPGGPLDWPEDWGTG